MAITAPTTLSGFSGFLNREQSAAIFEGAMRTSVVQRLARQVPLGASGQSIPVVTGRPTAGWTTEGTAKHGTSGGMTLVNMDPKKLTAIAVVSEEVARANPGGYMDWLYPALAEAFGIAFDYAALYDLGGDGTGSGPFDHYIAETTKSVEIGTDTVNGLHGDLIAGLSLLAADKKKLTGFVFGDVAEPLFLSAKDGDLRPLLSPSAAEGVYASVLGRPLMLEEGVDNGTTLGFGGDWSKAAWGNVGGINFKVSNEAAVTINGELQSAFENNLVIIRAEAEYGFVMPDAASFVKYVNVTP